MVPSTASIRAAVRRAARAACAPRRRCARSSPLWPREKQPEVWEVDWLPPPRRPRRSAAARGVSTGEISMWLGRSARGTGSRASMAGGEEASGAAAGPPFSAAARSEASSCRPCPGPPSAHVQAAPRARQEGQSPLRGLPVEDGAQHAHRAGPPLVREHARHRCEPRGTRISAAPGAPPVSHQFFSPAPPHPSASLRACVRT